MSRVDELREAFIKDLGDLDISQQSLRVSIEQITEAARLWAMPRLCRRGEAMTPEELNEYERTAGGILTSDHRELIMALREAWAALHYARIDAKEWRRKYEAWQSEILGEMQTKLATVEKTTDDAYKRGLAEGTAQAREEMSHCGCGIIYFGAQAKPVDKIVHNRGAPCHQIGSTPTPNEPAKCGTCGGIDSVVCRVCLGSRCQYYPAGTGTPCDEGCCDCVSEDENV